jgi:hypothetical protein
VSGDFFFLETGNRLLAGKQFVACVSVKGVTGRYIRFPPFSMATSAKEREAAQSASKPVKTFRLRGVSASAFQNHTESKGRDVTFHKVSLQRRYRDGDEWKTTSSFSRDDLPIARLLLERAWQFILDSEAKSRRSSDDDTEDDE